MTPEEKNIARVCTEITEKHGFMLIEIGFRGNPNAKIIEVFIDSEEDLSIDNCASVSREIKNRIDSEELFTSNYRLDVSSPGIERPLRYLKQYPKHVNRKFDLQYKTDDGSVKKFTGSLERIDGDILYFIDKKNELSVNFNNITKALVKISFS